MTKIHLFKHSEKKKPQVIKNHINEYEEWFHIFNSQVEALRDALPVGYLHGIEVGLKTGRFSFALGIKEGVEPDPEMRKTALGKGLEVMDATAEYLPYRDMHFDFVLMADSISNFNDLHKAFLEANRVLKRGGSLVVGFIDKDSSIAKAYDDRRKTSKTELEKPITFYSVEKIISELKNAGFHDLKFSQTLFKPLGKIHEFEPAKPGYGIGSFVVIKSIKK